MKKIGIVLIAIITIVSCSKETPKNYIALSGKFTNNTDSLLIITYKRKPIKTVKINKDGSFKDTLKVDIPETYTLQTGASKKAPIFLKNGFNLTLNGNADNFLKSFTYSGEGADSNNFLISKYVFGSTMGNPMDLFLLEKDAFDVKILKILQSFDSIQSLYKDIDSSLVAQTTMQNKQFKDYFTNNYNRQHKAAKERAESMKNLATGKPSPTFKGYENFKGGKKSLSDFIGKFVYIDVWATWCGPCKAEIPSLKKLEKEYHGKNIAFVSISIDNKRTAGSWKNANKKWKAMVADKQLTGTQLFAGEDIGFIRAYQINSIPRFIIIDPKGNIVNANAPRPSSAALKDRFKKLGI